MSILEMSPVAVWKAMGVGEKALAEGKPITSRMNGIAWILIQEMVKGKELKEIAGMLKVEAADLRDLIQYVTGEVGEAAAEIWSKGIVYLVSAKQAETQMLEGGWDSLESIALRKLNKTLNDMKTTGDPELMLKIANTANRAMRGQGEGKGMIPGGGNGGAVPVGQTGQLGVMQISVSVAVQEQLNTPKVVDGVANNKGLKNTEMLDLKATRVLADEKIQESRNEAVDAEYATATI